METVEGIGGFFFISPDPGQLADWYAQNLGITLPPDAYDAPVWAQIGGPTVFSPMPRAAKDAPIIGSAGWGLNFRVRDLDAIVAQLTSNGIKVDLDSEIYPNGRFGHLADPDGNAVQLWEPRTP